MPQQRKAKYYSFEWVPALLANARTNRKNFLGANTLAYCVSSPGTKREGLLALAPGWRAGAFQVLLNVHLSRVPRVMVVQTRLPAAFSTFFLSR
jgi:hypothetical protein